jgi:hypothetical protein
MARAVIITAQVSGFRQVSNHGMANITHPKEG